MTSNYILSFTAVSLAIYETETIANLYNEKEDWGSILHDVVEENILQKGTVATRKREFRELKKRVSTLTIEQRKLYSTGSSSDIRNLAILGCFKLYPFIYQFSSEVIREKLLLFDFTILNSDYEAFYESKRIAYDKLNLISEGTQYKLKQVMFKILEQAEFIDSVKNKNIQKPYLSEELERLIVADNPTYLSAFLYSNSDIRERIERYQCR